MVRAFRLLGLLVFLTSLAGFLVFAVRAMFYTGLLSEIQRLLFCFAFMMTGGSFYQFRIPNRRFLKYLWLFSWFIVGFGFLVCAAITAVVYPDTLRREVPFALIALALSFWSNVGAALHGNSSWSSAPADRRDCLAL